MTYAIKYVLATGVVLCVAWASAQPAVHRSWLLQGKYEKVTIHVPAMPGSGFVKITEYVSGAKNVKAGNSGADVAFAGNDSVLTWIFPAISEAIALTYSFEPRSEHVHISGRLETEKQAEARITFLPADTTLVFEVADVVFVKNEITNSSHSQVHSTASNQCAWKVQVSASVSPQPVSKFAQKLPPGASVTEERIDQWYKYTTGCFASRQEATEHMLLLEKRGFRKPFAVAYVNGNRVK